jgi:hypothetical protein
MCHTVERLFIDHLGVNDLVHDLEQDPMGKETQRALLKMLGSGPSMPGVFIGGNVTSQISNKGRRTIPNIQISKPTKTFTLHIVPCIGLVHFD